MASPADALSPVAADYFDGKSARPHAVWVHLDGDLLRLTHAEPPEPVDAAPPVDPPPVPVSEVGWPERTRHGARLAQLPGGAMLQARDRAGWDALAAAANRHESLVVRAQRSWRAVAVAVLALGVLAAATWQWGVPLASKAVLAVLPLSADEQVGQLTLRQARERWLMPTEVPAPRQAELRAAFERALLAAEPDPLPHRIEFAASRIGPNAFALPGGSIVVTDELVTLMAGDTDAITGVLAHEYGHVKHRHAMQQLVQATLLSAVTGLAFGDVGGVLATLPALLGSLSYSRDLERQADGEAILVLRDAGIGTAPMLRFFDAVAAWRAKRHDDDGMTLGIALSSHPADAERIARFRAGER